jgi:hypothetical protein
VKGQNFVKPSYEMHLLKSCVKLKCKIEINLSQKKKKKKEVNPSKVHHNILANNKAQGLGFSKPLKP